MDIIHMETAYAPAERLPYEEVKKEAVVLHEIDSLKHMVDSAPNLFMILNKYRQIVYANKTTMSFLGESNPADVLGLRPGEAFNCINSNKTEGGCGTAKFCRTCGAVNAILSSLQGVEDIWECRIVQKDNNSLDLRVWATPYRANGSKFSFFSVQDISDEKRRKVLERIFFHDIINTASGLKMYSELINQIDSNYARKIAGSVLRIADSICDQINAQKEISAAENNELAVRPEIINVYKLMKDIAEYFMAQDYTKNKNIEIEHNAVRADFFSDRNLLNRVLGNMMKNALEASFENDTIRLSCKQEGNTIIFSVHNPTVMPVNVKYQVFQRSFTTKGPGRGLGTYSIKLISEKYLNGRAFFSSNKDSGTTFSVQYPLKLSKRFIDGI